MLMPDKLALEFYQFDVLPVQLAHDPGVPVVVEEGELLTQVHLGDRSVSEDASDELPLADRIVKKIRDALCDDLSLECDILLQEQRLAPQPIPEGPQLQNLWRVNGDYVGVETQGRRIKMRVSGRLGTRAAASRCEFRVDWGPVSEYALMLLYSPTSRWFSRFLSYGVAHGESRIGFFSATLPGPSGPASGADPKTSVDQHRLRERLWRSFRCQFVRWNS